MPGPSLEYLYDKVILIIRSINDKRLAEQSVLWLKKINKNWADPGVNALLPLFFSFSLSSSYVYVVNNP
jgi:hypothetical protein